MLDNLAYDCVMHPDSVFLAVRRKPLARLPLRPRNHTAILAKIDPGFCQCVHPRRLWCPRLSPYREFIFSGSLDAGGTVAGTCATPKGEGRMSYMFLILAMGPLAATGIYNPQVMHHGHCIAAPGSVDALYCQAPAPAAPAHSYRHAKNKSGRQSS